MTLGTRVTVDVGHKAARVRIQGQSKLVYKTDSRVKVLLHKVRADQMEQEEAVILAKFVSFSFWRKLVLLSCI